MYSATVTWKHPHGVRGIIKAKSTDELAQRLKNVVEALVSLAPYTDDPAELTIQAKRGS